MRGCICLTFITQRVFLPLRSRSRHPSPVYHTVRTWWLSSVIRHIIASSYAPAANISNRRVPYIQLPCNVPTPARTYGKPASDPPRRPGARETVGTVATYPNPEFSPSTCLHATLATKPAPSNAVAHIYWVSYGGLPTFSTACFLPLVRASGTYFPTPRLHSQSNHNSGPQWPKETSRIPCHRRVQRTSSAD